MPRNTGKPDGKESFILRKMSTPKIEGIAEVVAKGVAYSPHPWGPCFIPYSSVGQASSPRNCASPPSFSYTP